MPWQRTDQENFTEVEYHEGLNRPARLQAEVRGKPSLARPG